MVLSLTIVYDFNCHLKISFASCVYGIDGKHKDKMGLGKLYGIAYISYKNAELTLKCFYSPLIVGLPRCQSCFIPFLQVRRDLRMLSLVAVAYGTLLLPGCSGHAPYAREDKRRLVRSFCCSPMAPKVFHSKGPSLSN